MAGIEVKRIKRGWRVEVDNLTVDAESPHFHRARTRIIRTLAGKDVILDDKVIIALDEACRTRRGTEPKKKSMRSRGTDFSGKGKYSSNPCQGITG